MIKDYLVDFYESLERTVITDKEGKELDHVDGYHKAAIILENLRDSKNTVYLVGNGGSSAVVSHASVDLINACQIKAYPIIDNSLLTCMANDHGYENVFSKTIDLSWAEGDAVLSVSGSGTSQNILNAADVANEKGGSLITYSGFEADNPLRKKGDVNFWVPGDDYGQLEIGHSLLIHILTDKLKIGPGR